MFTLKSSENDVGEVREPYFPAPASFAENFNKKYQKQIKTAELLTVLEAFYVYMAHGNEFTIKGIFKKT